MKKIIALLSVATICLLANGCAKVVGVTTSEPIDLDPNRRTFGTVIDDSQLETIAAVNIDKTHPDLKSAPISVTSYNRVILLTGQVRNNELRDMASKAVSNMEQVRQVHNELSIQAPISFLGDTNDAWLTTKIKSKFAFNKEVRANRMKVVTENGVVYLMGLVPRSEAEKASDIARRTSGVQKVVLAVEYTD
ncbi:BON domain-containing protein [Aurantivibrio infirmus]